jgi:hypothetical protein
MSEWQIIPSYKLDLACFCNLLTGAEMVLEKHKDGYDAFREIIHARPDLQAFADTLLQQGLMVGTATASLLSLSDYNGEDIEDICRLFDDDSNHPLIKNYLLEGGFQGDISYVLQSVLPVMSGMLKYFHAHGFHDYWREVSLPAIQDKLTSFQEAAVRYPVVSRVNQLLGFDSIKSPQVTLYLCSFNAPYGIGLKNAFISDIRWCFDDTVSVAVHELIHPPFDRAIIKQMAEAIREDEFFQEAKGRLPPSSGYHLPEEFLEENLVEGAHLYLGEQLGVVKDPLRYLLSHDFGSHVISIILYDALKKGYRDEARTLQETVERLIREDVLAPGQIKHCYMAIYQQAGLADQVPH